MKRLLIAAAAISMAGVVGVASAQPRQDDHRGQGPQNGPAQHNWRKGGRIERNDWSRGQPVDYRAHHLRKPRRGYEWREIDGNYVLAAVATGVIADLLLNHR